MSPNKNITIRINNDNVVEPNESFMVNLSFSGEPGLQCWEFDPKNRPTFSNLVQSLSQSLEAMAGYMDIGAFGGIIPDPSKTVASNPEASDEPIDNNSSEKETSQSKASESQEVMVDTTCDETSL